jgi:hypothetical protein
MDDKIAEEMIARLQRDLERTLYGGWPPGYEPGKGMPTGLTVEKLLEMKRYGR